MNKPFNYNQTLLDFVEECPEENLEGPLKEKLDALYEAKSDWELLLEIDNNARDYESVKNDRRSLAKIKDEIIVLKTMMKQNNSLKEELAAA